MHGAAQTANAPPSRAAEPRRCARCSRPGRDCPLRPGQHADERQPDHDQGVSRRSGSGSSSRRRPRSPLRRAERDEHDREAGDERQAGGDDSPAGSALAEAVDLEPRRPPRGSRGRAAARTGVITEISPARNATGSFSATCRDRVPGADGARAGRAIRRLIRSARALRRRGARGSGRAPARRAPRVPPGRRGCATTPTRRRRSPPHRPRCRANGISQASRSKPCLPGHAEHPRAELGDEPVLDLLLGPACGDVLADDRPSSAARSARSTRRAARGTSGRRARPRAGPATGARCSRSAGATSASSARVATSTVTAPRALARSAGTVLLRQGVPDTTVELGPVAAPMMCPTWSPIFGIETTRPRRSMKNVSG